MAQSIISGAQSRSKSNWDLFTEWVTSTNNRLYVGWFGTLMIPTLLAATICFIVAFVAAPPVDIDGFVNQSQAPSSGETTSSPEPWYPARTQLGYICTQCGKPVRWTNGFITAALTSSSCFTSSLASSATWVGSGNSAIDWE